MEEPIHRSTCWSIPCTIPRGDSELIYHPSACVRIIHCEVELWYIYAAISGQGRGVIAINHSTNTDINTVRDVRINSSYVQGEGGIPSEADNLLQGQIFTYEVAHSSWCAYKKSDNMH